MATITAPALSSLAALAAEFASARAVMAPAVPATVLKQVVAVREFQGRYALERIPLPEEGDREAAARVFNDWTQPHFARCLRPIFDERLAMEALGSRGIQLDALKLAPQIPEAAAAGLVTYAIAQGFLNAIEGQLNGVIDRGLGVLDRAPAHEPWRDPALILGLGGILTGIIGMALHSHSSLFLIIWTLGALSLVRGISRVNAAYGALRRNMGDVLEQLSERFQTVEEAQRRLLELRPEILRAAAGQEDQAVTRLRPSSLER